MHLDGVPAVCHAILNDLDRCGAAVEAESDEAQYDRVAGAQHFRVHVAAERN